MKEKVTRRGILGGMIAAVFGAKTTCSALPSQCVHKAIATDEKIRQAQYRFFVNGTFPGQKVRLSIGQRKALRDAICECYQGTSGGLPQILSEGEHV